VLYVGQVPGSLREVALNVVARGVPDQPLLRTFVKNLHHQRDVEIIVKKQQPTINNVVSITRQVMGVRNIYMDRVVQNIPNRLALHPAPAPARAQGPALIRAPARAQGRVRNQM